MNTIKHLLLLPLILLVGCSGEIAIEGQGDVLSSDGLSCYLETQPCKQVFTEGFQKTLTATPRDGWVFSGWHYCQESTGPVCRVEVDTETVKLGFGKKLPPITATFVKSQLSDYFPYANVVGCETNLPWDRQCAAYIGDRLRLEVRPSQNLFSWSYRRPNISGNALNYIGDYLETATGWVFTGFSGDQMVTAVLAGNEITISASLLNVWYRTEAGVLE